MSSPFHDAVVAQMAGLTGAAPDANDFYYRNVRHAPGIGVGVLHPSPSALLVPPTRAEIEAAIELSRPGDSDSQKINALQSQVNILLRLFLSRSLSSSPRLRSGSGSPVVVPSLLRPSTFLFHARTHARFQASAHSAQPIA